VDYLILTADELLPAAEKFADYRRSTQHTPAIVTMSEVLDGEKDPKKASVKIRDRVKATWEARDAGKPMFLLIVGDTIAKWAGQTSMVPAHTYIEPFDSTKITNDNFYAEMTGDHIPDIAVGRVAVPDEAAAEVVLEKVKAYEQTYEPGLWNRRLNLFASEGGFGNAIDSFIEGMVFQMVEELPYRFDISMTYASQQSPYVYVPEQFSDKVYERINEGSLITAYVGHGYPGGFDDLHWNGGAFPILDTAHLDGIATAHRSPILTFIACSTGSFDTDDSVSERILRLPGAPGMVLSSTEESHPYTNAIFIRELAQVVTTATPPTIGEAFLQAKDRMVNQSDKLRQAIDALAAQVVPPEEQVALKRSHQYMYTIFGDPALRIRYPGEAAVSLGAAKASPGGVVQVSASFAGLGAGQARVTLESRRSIIPAELADVPADGDPTRDAVIEANYQKANNKVVVEVMVPHDGATLSAELVVPAGLYAGDYWVKVYADDGAADVGGAAKITVVAP
jgi:hypothetical protein